MKQAQEWRIDVRADSVSFSDGDAVWLYNPLRNWGLSPKLQSDWEGPYVTENKINDVVYRVSELKKGKFKVVHVNRLAKYYTDVSDRDEHVWEGGNAPLRWRMGAVKKKYTSWCCDKFVRWRKGSKRDVKFPSELI